MTEPSIVIPPRILASVRLIIALVIGVIGFLLAVKIWEPHDLVVVVGIVFILTAIGLVV